MATATSSHVRSRARKREEEPEHLPISELFARLAFHASQTFGTPWAFIAALALILGWAASGPFFGFSETWQLVINTSTTIITFLMVFLIQATQNRDARAIHLKLDELVRATSARNVFADLEDATEAELDEHYSTAYGIFGGKADKVAVLRFTPERARWVADERWHPQQEGTWLPDGSYELRIPYRESRELMMDVMRHGAAVIVVSPMALTDEVSVELRRAAATYGPSA